MNCSNCGNPLAPDSHFCTHCGARILGTPITAPQPVSYYGGFTYNRVAKNLQALGVLWLVYAGLRLLTGIAGMFFLHGFFGHSVGMGWSPFGHSFGFLWPMALFSTLISVGCAFLTGYGLMTRQPWGRILAIVFGIFALIHIPFGTALGVYTLWVLASRLSGDEYAALSH
jgi:ABC-type glycerol-3-phosphate transport system permease component